MRQIEYGDRDRGMLTLEELDIIYSAPKFLGVGYCFIKTFWYKEGNHPFNSTMVWVLVNDRFHILW